jgi:hypothetical protein
MHLAHPYEAKIGEVRLAIRIALGEGDELINVGGAVERDANSSQREKPY